MSDDLRRFQSILPIYGIPGVEPGKALIINEGNDGWRIAEVALGGAVALVISSGAVVEVDASAGHVFDVTLDSTGIAIPAPINPRDGRRIIFRLKQDGSGSRTVTWNAIYRFSGGTEPTLTTTAAKTDVVGFIYNAAAAKWDCVAERLDF